MRGEPFGLEAGPQASRPRPGLGRLRLFWVETVLEGVTIRYSGGTPYDELRGYVGQRNMDINSLTDFNTALDWANPSPPPHPSMRQRLRNFLE